MLAIALVGALLGPAPIAEESREPEAQPVAQTPVIVFMHGEADDEAADADAIAAHLHELDVDLRREIVPEGDPSLDDAYARADASARLHDARAVVWVRRAAPRAYTVYLVRPGSRRVLLRSVARDPDMASAALETLAIVTRSIVAAVLADAPIEMDVIELAAEPPAPEPPVEPRPPPSPSREIAPRGRGLVELAYFGTSYARQAPWQSGLDLRAGYGWPIGIHVGLGYAVVQRVRSDHALGRVEVARHPLQAFLGYHRTWRNFVYGADLGLVFDPTVRRASAIASGLDARDERTRLHVAVAPRLRGAIVAIWRLEVFAAIGLEAWFSRERFAIQPIADDPRVVLTPRWVRATVHAGLAVRL